MSFDDHHSAAPLVSDPALVRLIAPRWHTLLLVVVLLGISVMSAGSQAEFVETHGRMPVYLMTIAWEWMLTAYVIWGLRHAGTHLNEVNGRRWSSPAEALRDVIVAAIFWLLSSLVLAAMAWALRLDSPENVEAARRQVSFLFPQTGPEVAAWIALSATAGFCEEIIFRGYLQTQLQRLHGAVWFGVIVQGLVFGGSHAYEGWQRMIIIGIWGIMFGILAVMRRNLRPGMIAHGFHNLLTGMMGRVLLK